MIDRQTFPYNLPQGWAIATIPEIVGKGGVFCDGDWVESKDQDPNGDVRLIQLANVGDGVFRNRSSRFLTLEKAKQLRCTFLNQGDLLIARMPDPLGRSCLFVRDPKPCVTVVDVCIVRLNPEEASPHWLMCWMNCPHVRSQVAGLQSGSTRKRISRSNLAKLELPVPPLPEQHRIVAKIEELFTKLDAGVEALEKVKAELKRYRQSVLKYAFEGKLTAEWREANKDKIEPASVLLDRIREERKKVLGAKYKEPPPVDTSDLPELPEEWEWARIEQVFDVHVGATPSRKHSEYWGGDIPWVSSGEVAFCRIRGTRETITHLGLENSSTQVHPAGTVLLGMIGEGKTRGQAAILDIAACNNQNSAAIRLDGTGIPPEYLFGFLQSQYEETRRLGSGGNQPALNKDRVKAIVLPLAPVLEQDVIVREINRVLSDLEDTEAIIRESIVRSDRLRQSILKTAFQGKLVPQDLSEEPAEKLLERIKAEKAERVSTARGAPRQKGQKGR